MRVSLHVLMGYQGCFLLEGGTFYLGAGAATSFRAGVSTYVQSLGKGDRLVLLNLVRKPGDTYYEMEPDYCMVGSVDISHVDSVHSRADRVFQHHRPDLMTCVPFRTFLASNDVECVHLLGLETHRSILQTAQSLRSADYRVVVHAGNSAARDLYFHETALSLLAASVGAEVM